MNAAATRAAYTTYGLAALAVVVAGVLLMVNGGGIGAALGVAAALVAPVAVIALGVFTFLAQGRSGSASAGMRHAVGSAAAAIVAVSALWISVIAAAAIGVASLVARLIGNVADALGLSLEVSAGGASTIAAIGAALAVVAAVGAIASDAATLAALHEK